MTKIKLDPAGLKVDSLESLVTSGEAPEPERTVLRMDTVWASTCDGIFDSCVGGQGCDDGVDWGNYTATCGREAARTRPT